MVDSFIEEYNATAPTPITDAVEINVTDKESGHYRTEFRLGAFKDSIAKTGKIGDTVIDVVNCGWQKDELRIYADNITSEQAVEIVKYAAPVMDPDVPSDELQDVLDYLSGTNSYHNGYFGNLCMTYNEVDVYKRQGAGLLPGPGLLGKRIHDRGAGRGGAPPVCRPRR